MCVCTCPMTAELKQGVRMQKTLRNTSGQVREEPEGKKRHSLKCTGYFILINSSARHPTRAAVWADTNHCIISRTWCIWEQLVLSTAVKAACPGKPIDLILPTEHQGCHSPPVLQSYSCIFMSSGLITKNIPNVYFSVAGDKLQQPY